MKKYIFFLMAIAAYHGHAQKNDTELMNADKAFAHLSYTDGVAAAFDAYLAEDAAFLSSTPLPIVGKANFMKIFSNSSATVIWQPTGGYKDASGKSGYTYGLSKWMYPDGDSLGCAYYVYNTNWVKDQSNQWKVTTDIGTEISLKNYPLAPKETFHRTKQAKPIIEKTVKEKQIKLVHFSFESDRRGQVPAIVVQPIKQPLKALVCYQHGLGEQYSKEMFLEEAKQLAAQGIASILLDAPFKRKGDSYIAPGGMQDAEIIVNNCVEWLQAVELLPQLEINTDNYIFVGHSYGARVAALMPYLDNRFQKLVIVGGIYNYAEWLQSTMVADINALRATLAREDLKSYVASLANFDASRYLHRKNKLQVFFQAGKQDETLTEYDILSCYEMTNCTKEIAWYDAPHSLGAQATQERIAKLLAWAGGAPR